MKKYKKELIKRLTKEQFKLCRKIEKLEVFLSNDKNFKHLDLHYTCLMVQQLEIMKDYRNILSERISLIKV